MQMNHHQLDYRFDFIYGQVEETKTKQRVGLESVLSEFFIIITNTLLSQRPLFHILATLANITDMSNDQVNT